MKLLFLFAAFLLTLSKASIGEFALKTEDGQVAVGEGTDLMRNPFENPLAMETVEAFETIMWTVLFGLLDGGFEVDGETEHSPNAGRGIN